jgi:linoleoyl-CoA desaturase
MAKYKKNVQYNMRHNLEFQRTVRDRVAELIQSKGGNPKGNRSMLFRVLGLLAAHLSIWFLLATQSHSLLVTSVLIFAFAVVSQTIVCNVMHEAGHTSVTGNKKVDDFFTWISCSMLGMSARLYQLRHNDAHHMFTNIPGLDTDIEASKIIRFVPHTEWKSFHRFQQWYAPVLYSLFTLHWIFLKDFKVFRQKELGNLIGVTHTRLQQISIYTMKLAYVAYMIIIPAVLLPYHFGLVVAGFLAYQLVLSTMVTLMIGGLHIFEGTEFVMHNEKGQLPYSFMEHSLRTSAEFYPRSKIANFFFCAFNTHAIHHIFPNISSNHYPQISVILKKATREFGIPYHDLTYFQLIRAHLRFIKHMGSAPEAGFETINVRCDRDESHMPGLKFTPNLATEASGQKSEHLAS